MKTEENREIKPLQIFEPSPKPQKCLYAKIMAYTVYRKPRPEAHMDMILFDVFLKNIHLIPQDQIVQWHYLYII